jgi:hypothetical protein
LFRLPLWFFIKAGEDLVMVDDIVMLWNLLVALIEKEKLEETSFDMNVSQWLCDKKSFQKVVYTRADRSTWDRRSSPNPHVLAIYIEFVPVRGTTPTRFEKRQCEINDFCLHYQTWVLGDGHYHWLQCPINPFFMEHRIECLVRTIHHILDFL